MVCDKSSPHSSNNNSNDTPNSNNASDNTPNPNDIESPDNSSNSDPSPNYIPNNPPRVYSPNDPRCIDCGHERFRCEICTPRIANVNGMTRKKYKELTKLWELVGYCCKCTGVSRFSRHINPEDDEKHALVKQEPSDYEAAAQLRSFLLEPLQGEQSFCHPDLCDVVPRFGERLHDGESGASNPAIIVMSCRMPQPTIPKTVFAVQVHLCQVSNIVQRLISLLSSDGPIDEGLLNTILRTLFNRLAILNHRAFPSLAQTSSIESKARQHMSQVSRNQVQTAYRELWHQAQQSGFLKRVRSHGSQLRGLRVGEVELHELLVGLEQRAAVWGLLFRARELADKLQFWRAVLMAPGPM